jgi:hypothetical protein
MKADSVIRKFLRRMSAMLALTLLAARQVRIPTNRGSPLASAAICTV